MIAFSTRQIQLGLPPEKAKHGIPGRILCFAERTKLCPARVMTEGKPMTCLGSGLEAAPRIPPGPGYRTRNQYTFRSKLFTISFFSLGLLDSGSQWRMFQGASPLVHFNAVCLSGSVVRVESNVLSSRSLRFMSTDSRLALAPKPGLPI